MSKFCTSCGAPINPQSRFCGECGGPSDPNAAPAERPAAPTSPALGLSDNGASTLAYAFGFITGIVFLVLEPYNRSKTVRFHALHSIIFNAAWIALYVVITIVSLILAAVIPLAVFGFGIGALMMVFNAVLWLGGVALWVLLMVKAYQGEELKLPIVSRLARKYADKIDGGPGTVQDLPTSTEPPPPPDVAQPDPPLGPSEPPSGPPPESPPEAPSTEPPPEVDAEDREDTDPGSPMDSVEAPDPKKE